MVLSKRERYVAIGLIAAIGIFVFDRILLTPYMARRDVVAADRARAAEDLGKAADLFERKRKLNKVWTEMQKGGLKVDASQAESQALHAVLDAAQSAGVSLAALKPERPVQQGKFQVISFHVTGTGPMSSLSRLLWALETTTIPVRVTDMQVTPRREGSDDLSLQMSVSTLCMLPDAQSPAKPVASAAVGGTQP